MLENLEILNGSIDKQFDSSIYEYEVSVESDVLALIFNYDVSEEVKVTIYGNDELTFGENHVYIEVYYNNEVTTYTFVVNKNLSQTVSLTNEELFKENNTFLQEIRTPGIAVVCFLLIIIAFCIIFKKK